MACAGLMVVALVGRPTQGIAKPAPRVTFQGTVIDKAGTPLEWVNVHLCTEGERRRGVVESPFTVCEVDLAEAITNKWGRFRIRSPAYRPESPARLIVDHAGYLEQIVPLPKPGSGSSMRPFRITLRAVAEVGVQVVDAQDRPVAHASVGWFYEQEGTIKTKYHEGCTPDDVSRSGVAEGPVTFFATTGGATPHFAIQEVETHSGSRSTITLRAVNPLQRLRGRVVDADGSPLPARVSVEPIEPNGFSAVDRVLLKARGKNTDRAGNFEFLITSPARVLVRLSTWFAWDPTTTDDVRDISLATVPAQFGLDSQPVVLRAPKAPLVRCTIIGTADERPAIAELGISFVPHGSPGHSGPCTWVGGPSSDNENLPPETLREATFIWPGGAETLFVWARPVWGTMLAGSRGQPQDLLGIVTMKSATDPCQITVTPSERGK